MATLPHHDDTGAPQWPTRTSSDMLAAARKEEEAREATRRYRETVVRTTIEDVVVRLKPALEWVQLVERARWWHLRRTPMAAARSLAYGPDSLSFRIGDGTRRISASMVNTHIADSFPQTKYPARFEVRGWREVETLLDSGVRTVFSVDTPVYYNAAESPANADRLLGDILRAVAALEVRGA